MRAVPPIEKVRAVGSVNWRAMDASGSDRGGVTWVRIRLTRMSRGWAREEVPAAVSRSVGSRSTSVAGATPGTVMSAKPTALWLR